MDVIPSNKLLAGMDMALNMVEPAFFSADGLTELLKEYSKQGLLNSENAAGIIRASKGCKRKIVLHDDKISKFFDARYSDDEIETIILELLQKCRNRNQR